MGFGYKLFSVTLYLAPGRPHPSRDPATERTPVETHPKWGGTEV